MVASCQAIRSAERSTPVPISSSFSTERLVPKIERLSSTSVNEGQHSNGTDPKPDRRQTSQSPVIASILDQTDKDWAVS
jgi:hypothetical protein